MEKGGGMSVGLGRSRLTQCRVGAISAIPAGRRPGVLLSAAVYPDATEASNERFQDWRFWVENRWLDVVCPMAYTPEAARFADQITAARTAANGRPIWAGIGAYRLTPSQTVDNIQTARRIGAAGVILFSYDSLTDPKLNAPGYLEKVAKAAFQPAAARPGSH